MTEKQQQNTLIGVGVALLLFLVFWWWFCKELKKKASQQGINSMLSQLPKGAEVYKTETRVEYGSGEPMTQEQVAEIVTDIIGSSPPPVEGSKQSKEFEYTVKNLAGGTDQVVYRWRVTTAPGGTQTIEYWYEEGKKWLTPLAIMAQVKEVRAWYNSNKDTIGYAG